MEVEPEPYPAAASEEDAIPKAVLDVLRRHSGSGFLCSDRRCSNDDASRLRIKTRDEFGFVTEVECANEIATRGGLTRVCRNEMSTACYRRSSKRMARVHNIDELIPGDHIMWHRLYGIWHHAIYLGKSSSNSSECFACGTHVKVVETYPSDVDISEDVHLIESVPSDETNQRNKERMDIIEFNRPPDGDCCCPAFRIQVSRKVFEKTDLFRVEYDDSYDVDYSIERAEKRVGNPAKNKAYCVLWNNCEHLADWCKTGNSRSSQVTKCVTFFGKNLLNVAIRLIGLVTIIVIDAVFDNLFVDMSSEEKNRLLFAEKMLSNVFVVVLTFVYIIYKIQNECSQIKVAGKYGEGCCRCCRKRCCRGCGIACSNYFGVGLRITLEETLSIAVPLCLSILCEEQIQAILNNPWQEAIAFIAIYLGITVVVFMCSLCGIPARCLEYGIDRCIECCNEDNIA